MDDAGLEVIFHRFHEPVEKYVKRRREAAQCVENKGDRMVGVTGIEPVTPTMSTYFPCLNVPQLR